MGWFLRADGKIGLVEFEEVSLQCSVEFCGTVYCLGRS